MKRSRYSDEQIAYALRQAEAGTAVGDVCRQLGISDATFYVWKKRFGHMAVVEVRELRQLREENAKLKRLVADLSLDKSILTEIVRKKSEAGTATRARDVGAGHLAGWDLAGVPAIKDFEGAVVLPQPAASADGAGDAHPGAGPCPPTIRRPACSCVAAPRGLGGEPQAGPPAVSAGRTAARFPRIGTSRFPELGPPDFEG